MTPAGVEAWVAAAGELGALPGSSRTASARATALERFSARGFPSVREEAWRTTNVAALARTPFRPAPPPTAAELAHARRLLASLGAAPAEAVRLAFVNGHHAPSLSRRVRREPGLEVRGLAEAFGRGLAGTEDLLGRLATGEEHAFSALNAALWADGAWVRVERGRDPPPLHLVFLSVGERASLAVHPRVLYVVEAGAHGRVLETWAGDAPAERLVNPVVEGFLGEGARLDLVEVQQQPPSTHHFRTARFRLERDAALAATAYAAGAARARSELLAVLAGTGVACRLDGLSLLGGEQAADHQTTIEHAQPHGASRQLYKAVVDGRARAAFAGRIAVRAGAQHTDAVQACHNVLLSPEATADAKPELEILADDVKCSHGATVGQLDSDSLFYLRARGLGEADARALLIRAFAGEVVARVEDETLRGHLESLVADRLGGTR